LFSLCFTCVYLMPSLTCEERERGLLLAQALSPATATEILAAKFLFYPAFGILLATLLAGIHNPVVLSRPFFWMSLGTLSVGVLGIGMTIACLAKTQRAASLGALCYMLAVALVLVEGMSYKEASEVLEIPMGTLTSRLARGRTALAASLGEG
jgi:hypothetical protein